MTNLKRISIQYVETEDRLKLVGEVPDAPAVVLWLTPRLVNRLIPHLCKWLEQQTGSTPLSEIKHEFAQQKARADLEHQSPVKAEMDTQGVLVHSANLKPSGPGMSLQFKDKDGNVLASFQFQPKSLRQWLNILYDQCLRAEWSISVWPIWVSESKPQQQSGRTTVLH